MPSWGEILNELQATVPPTGGLPDWDGVRRKYLTRLYDLTAREVIVYETDWLGGGGPAALISMRDEPTPTASSAGIRP